MKSLTTLFFVASALFLMVRSCVLPIEDAIWDSTPKLSAADTLVYVDTVYYSAPEPISNHQSGKAKQKPFERLESAEKHVQDYVKRFLPTANREQDVFGIPISIKLGQAILESAFGTSRLAREGKNHFGLKHRQWPEDLTNEVEGIIDVADDCPGLCQFSAFRTDWASFRAHSYVLMSERYESLKSALNYIEWAEGLQAAGYASDPDYSKNLIAVIESYDLWQFDEIVEATR